jgi:predicted thioesterase
MKPTAIGKTVVCTSKVVDIENTKIKFEVFVEEDGKVIGKGTHTRFVIDKNAFLEML